MEAAAVDADDYPGVEKEAVGALKKPHVLEPGDCQKGVMGGRKLRAVYFELAMRGDRDGGGVLCTIALRTTVGRRSESESGGKTERHQNMAGSASERVFSGI